MKPETHLLAPLKISADTWEGLKQLAMREETSISGIARKLLREGLRREFKAGGQHGQRLSWR